MKDVVMEICSDLLFEICLKDVSVCGESDMLCIAIRGMFERCCSVLRKRYVVHRYSEVCFSMQFEGRLKDVALCCERGMLSIAIQRYVFQCNLKAV